MPEYVARNRTGGYGHGIGVILLDANEAHIPGDVGNASTYAFPVLYRVVPGLTGKAALSGDDSFKVSVIEAARELAQNGVKGISSNCGFLLYHQKDVARTVNIPVMLSSLLLIPLIAQSAGENAAIGVITASSKKLNKNLLDLAGVSSRTTIHVAGLEDSPAFRSLCDSGRFHSIQLEAEVVETARTLKERYRDIEAILLECSLLPPYAAAVQAAAELPVFDFVTMINFLFAVTHQRVYQGFY